MNSQDIKDVLEVSRILGGYSVDVNEAETVAALIKWKNSNGTPEAKDVPKTTSQPEPPPSKTRTKRQAASADSDTDF